MAQPPQAARDRVERWAQRAHQWAEEADAPIQRTELRQRRVSVEEERRLAEERLPERRHLRPLLVVAPRDDAIESEVA